MSLVDALAAERADRPRHCRVAKIVANLDSADAAALTEALASDLSSRRIQSALRATGVDISDSTIKAHRRLECACRR